MGIWITENFASQEYTEQESNVRLYTINGVLTSDLAIVLLDAAAPATLNLLIRGNLTVEEIGDMLWLGRAPYQKAEDMEEGSQRPGYPAKYSFDTTGGTQRVTHSIATVSIDGPDTPPDFKGAINVTKDGVEGVDIGVSVYKFSETLAFEDADITDGYKQTLSDNTHTVNDASFRGYDEGEVLFMGASGSSRGDGSYEITFHYAASINASNITIPATSNITVSSKEGWEYLWVYYESEEDTSAKAMVKRARGAYVEQVYNKTDFDDLEP